MRLRYSFSSRKTRVARAEKTNKHRVAYPKLAKDVIRISDIVLEVVDARFIDKTRNVDMEELVKKEGKTLVYVINKMDIANGKQVKFELQEKNLKPFVLYSCKSQIGRKQLRLMIKIMVKRGKFAEKHAKAHVGVIGYPNTGKSSLINTLVAGGRANTAPESGFTKGIHKIRFNKDIIILDTPGVFKENEGSLKQAEIGSRDAGSVKNPYFVVHNLMQQYHGLFESFYDIDARGNSELLVETIARKKGFILKGNAPDIDRASRCILADWQSGKIKKQKTL